MKDKKNVSKVGMEKSQKRLRLHSYSFIRDKTCLLRTFYVSRNVLETRKVFPIQKEAKLQR